LSCGFWNEPDDVSHKTEDLYGGAGNHEPVELIDEGEEVWGRNVICFEFDGIGS
jgi:hypothetical protein